MTLNPMSHLNAYMPLTFRLQFNQLCIACLLLISLLFSYPAHSHSALIINSIEAFEAQTNLVNAETHISNTIALVDALTDQQMQGAMPEATSEMLSTQETEPEFEAATETEETVAVNDIWDRIRAGFAMDDIEHPAVKQFERSFCKNPQLLTEMMHNAEKYLFYVTEAIEQQNMPTELALLPLVESRYDPTARSGASAAGLWQIMPKTGKYLGLKQDWWIDERYDISASTSAALNYLSSFYDRFEDWPLALAAYNAGAGTVSRAIKRNQSAKHKTDYLHLNLPKETKNYLPKLQAIKNIVANPEHYGIDIKPIDDKPYFTSVDLPEQIDKGLLTQLADISHEELTALNPQLKRPLITRDATPQIHLPVDAAERFEANLSMYTKPLVSWQVYTLPAGERLSRIAKQFDIPAKKLGKLNQIATHRRHAQPVSILVPNKKALSARQKSSSALPNVFTDDMLIALQQTSNLSASALKSLSKNNALIQQPSKKQRTYVVKRGDTLSTIAQRYNLSWKKIQRLNHLKNRLLKAGQRIKLY